MTVPVAFGPLASGLKECTMNIASEFYRFDNHYATRDGFKQSVVSVMDAKTGKVFAVTPDGTAIYISTQLPKPNMAHCLNGDGPEKACILDFNGTTGIWEY